MDTNWFESEEVDRRMESWLEEWSLEDKVNLVSGKLVVDDSG